MAVERALENIEQEEAGPREIGPTIRVQSTRSCSLSVEVLEGTRILDHLRQQWDELFARREDSRLTGSWTWNNTWWNNLGSRDRGKGESNLVIFACRDAKANLVGVMACHYNRKLGDIGPNSIYPLGLRLLLPTGVLDHRDLYSFTEEPTHLILNEHVDEATEMLAAAALDFVKRKGLDGFMFEVDEATAISKLKSLAERQKSKYLGATKEYEGSHVRKLPQDWPTLRGSLSKSMKDKISYSPRFIERNGLSWDLEIVRDSHEFAEGLEQVCSLHRLRADSHTGRFHNDYFVHPHQKEFLTEIASELSKTSNAFVARLKIQGQVVAAQLFFEHRGEIIVTYSGFDPTFHKFSPLFLLLCEVIKKGIDSGCTSVNFLVSGDQYQTRWGAVPASMRHRTIFVRRKPLPLARFGLFIWSRNRKNSVKRAACEAVAKNRQNDASGDHC